MAMTGHLHRTVHIRFHVRSMFVFVAIVASLCAIVGNYADSHLRQHHLIKALSYDYPVMIQADSPLASEEIGGYWNNGYVVGFRYEYVIPMDLISAAWELECETFTAIMLANRPVDDAPFEMSLLSSFPDLRVVELVNWKVDDDGWAAIKSLPNLERIVFYETAVPDSFIRDLKSAKPNVKIEQKSRGE